MSNLQIGISNAVNNLKFNQVTAHKEKTCHSHSTGADCQGGAPQLKTKHKTFRTFIIGNLLMLSLLTLSSCADNSGMNSDTSAEVSTKGEITTASSVTGTGTNGEITTVSSPPETESGNTDTEITLPKHEYGYEVSDVTLAQVIEPTDDKNKDTLLPEEIKACLEKLSDIIEAEGFEYDIDFDGNNEFLCTYMGFLKVFKKSDNVIWEKTAKKDGFHYVKADDLKTLQTYDDGMEKYSYFNYKYDAGSMKCNVLTAIKYDSKKDIYIVEDIVSWGKLEFEGDASKYNRPFFRKGWDSTQKGVEETEDDITQEEFLKIYNKYENLPAWDEYLY